ncbi:PLP-dependent cysteine synthase family protein [Aspergillus alliaceus]|uniref:PLP-dependent cysteine synthase family protein n=1 Tax=Petromyces alliaceus TaxID=209559 RepID=UPI0012A6A293|nr:tryptophan synthase beta subunit-like PLP-dependent enzyme [Aspergillus alliaceus]KAB8237934.1 tryptophan synthase beta subunit-like PLP-dependent enzyme [Aspergillus alliaceus]
MNPPAPVDSPFGLVRNTPVVCLRHVVPEDSYKDRMAKSIVKEAEARGALKPGMTVLKATGGSTVSSLAFICAAKGYQFQVESSNAFSLEDLPIMQTWGSSFDLIHCPSGQIIPDSTPSMVPCAKEVSTADNHYFADRFNNKDRLVVYELSGHELVRQFPDGIDAFCGAVGGTGMVMGTHVAVLEPAPSSVIAKGHTEMHHVEGIGSGFMPPHLDRNLYDEARAVTEEARAMCPRLAKEEGLLVKTSPGLNVAAAIALVKQLGPDRTVATVAVDTGL